MKILHINTYDTGGSAIAAIRLHKELLSQGYDSNFLFLYQSAYTIPNSFYFSIPKKKKHNFFIRQLKKLQKTILNESSEANKNNAKLKNKPIEFEMFSFATTDFDITTQKIYQEADIVHLNWVSGFMDHNFFKKNTKPLVWTLHDMNPFTGGCHYSSGCEKYISECKNCPQLQNTINSDSSFENQNYKMQMLSGQQIIIVSPSEWLRGFATDSKLFRHCNTKHIANCIDFSIFRPLNKLHCREILNITNNKKVLLFVSDNYLNKRKGFDLLLEALTLIDDNEITLVAIGGQSMNLTVMKNIHFLGSVQDERLMSVAYSAADIFILPSREDNLPNVMLESLACGTPVISYNVGGMSEVIIDGFNGILVKDISSAALSEAIKDFIQDKFNFDSKEIREHARLEFQSATQASKYVEVYQNIMR